MTPSHVLIATAVISSVAARSAPAQDIEPAHTVRSILQDSSGVYWFGTWSHGVYRYDGETTTRLTMKDGLASDQVRSIIESAECVVLFETATGVSRFDGDRFTTLDRFDYLTNEQWRFDPGDVWFKGESGHGITAQEGAPGVYRYDGIALRYHAFPFATDLGADAYYSVTGIDQRSDSRIWIAMYGAVVGYDGEDFVTIDNESLGLTEETGFLHVRCVFEDSQGRVWIGNNGIGVFVREGETTTHFTQAQGVGRRDHRSGANMNPRPGDAPEGQPSLHRVFAIGEDSDGAIWFGTIEQGAWRYDGERLQQFTQEHGLNTKDVTAIYTDADGVLWIGGAGVYRFNGTTFE